MACAMTLSVKYYINWYYLLPTFHVCAQWGVPFFVQNFETVAIPKHHSNFVCVHRVRHVNCAHIPLVRIPKIISFDAGAAFDGPQRVKTLHTCCTRCTQSKFQSSNSILKHPSAHLRSRPGICRTQVYFGLFLQQSTHYSYYDFRQIVAMILILTILLFNFIFYLSVCYSNLSLKPVQNSF